MIFITLLSEKTKTCPEERGKGDLTLNVPVYPQTDRPLRMGTTP